MYKLPEHYTLSSQQETESLYHVCVCVCVCVCGCVCVCVCACVMEEGGKHGLLLYSWFICRPLKFCYVPMHTIILYHFQYVQPIYALWYH